MFGDERSDSRGIRIALMYTHSFGVRLSCMVALPLTLSLLLLLLIPYTLGSELYLCTLIVFSSLYSVILLSSL